MVAGAALMLASSLGMAATGTTPVQAAGGGASADEYAKKSDLGFQWKGDARSRFDYLQYSNAVGRLRFRARLRVGANGTFGDKKAFWGFKLATNAGDPVSRNLTLGGGDANGVAASISLDQAYLGFIPHEKVKITVGKMGNPYQTSEAIFDGDLTPPGVAVDWNVFKGEKGDTIKNVTNTLGWFAIRDVTAATDDPFAILEQIRGDVGPVQLAAELFYFGNLNSRPQPAAPAALLDAAAMGQAGNQLVARVFPSNEMAVLGGSIRYPFSIGTFPMAVRGEAFANLSETDTKQYLGWELKLEFPKLGSKGKGHLIGRDVAQFATFSPWADSDLGEGTGYHAGIEAEYVHKLTNNVELALSYFHYDTNRPFTAPLVTRSYNRFFVDVQTKF